MLMLAKASIISPVSAMISIGFLPTLSDQGPYMLDDMIAGTVPAISGVQLQYEVQKTRSTISGIYRDSNEASCFLSCKVL